ncbi:MAG: anthranilate synthase component I [Methanoregulaceae archaeon]
MNLGIEEYLAVVEHQAKPLVIPLCAEIPVPNLSPLELFSNIRKTYGYLLESIEGSEKIARYSYIGIDPELMVTIDESIELKGEEPYTSIAKNPDGQNPVDKIKSILQRFNFVNIKAPRFFGGMVGYFAYDLVYSLNKNILKSSKPSSNLPITQFMLTKDCIVFDHLDKKLYIFCSPLLTYDSDIVQEYEKSRKRILESAEEIERLEYSKDKKPLQSLPDERSLKYTEYLSKDAFEQSVTRVKEYIKAGDIFQAVLSRRIEVDINSDPFLIYRALREINPSPYMYYLDFGNLKVIGASPEMLVRIEKRKVTTVPIAGTRLRGATPEEDKYLAEQLLADEKERAEHTMLVDLARNDIGRICKFGSVRVEDFMGVEKFSHVQHIVSTVKGILQDNLDGYEAFKSCFPAGTVSGAPKIRAMQIIDEVEPDRRGLYAGAVGYIGFDRNLEFAITIRTIIVHGSKASIQVGAGIVADSDPEKEWYETENKAQAMLKAIELGGRYQ